MGLKLGFILASAGSAIGLGAIWKFPFWAGTNGGAAFIIPYIFFTFTIGVTLLIAELTIGRAGRGSALQALDPQVAPSLQSSVAWPSFQATLSCRTTPWSEAGVSSIFSTP